MCVVGGGGGLDEKNSETTNNIKLYRVRITITEITDSHYELKVRAIVFH